MATTHTIIETRMMVGNWQEYTGEYRLIGIPGDSLDLPGRGGKVTQDAAARALQVFASGGDWQQAHDAAWDGRRS